MLKHIIFITACAQNVLLQHERKRWTLTPLADTKFNDARPRAAHSLLMRHFSSSMYDFEINTTSVTYATGFQWSGLYGLSDFLSWRMRSPIWILCCIRPNYDFCISEGSVATKLRWNGLKCTHVKFFFMMLCAKKYQNRLMLHGVIRKVKVACFYWDTV